ncbi:hypothetical protein PQR71_15470 [Paraburkholderia fungorum]|jgi:hypothetical protein|uniref:hypothetical protein n=1 Tax=Paraburkholderia fungorum TaxID=134537 RepID=UPI0038BA15A9
MSDSAELPATFNFSDGESAGQFDTAYNHVRDMTHARCAVVIAIDGESGSGYSVVGPLDAQVLLPDLLQKMANTLRGHLPVDFGQCRHWAGRDSTSAIWRIADGDSIERLGGSFLHLRTHTFDPQRPAEMARSMSGDRIEAVVGGWTTFLR